MYLLLAPYGGQILTLRRAMNRCDNCMTVSLQGNLLVVKINLTMNPRFGCHEAESPIDFGCFARVVRTQLSDDRLCHCGLESFSQTRFLSDTSGASAA